MEIGGSIAALGANPKKPDDPKRIHEAAQQFESFLISQIMKSMSSSGSFLGTDDDQAGSTAIEMAEEEFAKSLSAQGGLGLAKMVEASLKSSASPAGGGVANASHTLAE